MNQASKRQYDSAYRQLANGQSATYHQESGGTRVEGEWIAGTPSNTAITAYQDSPSTSDIQKGLASITDVKVLIAAKSMPLVTAKIGDTIIFTEYTITVQQVDPVKSLEGITVLWQLFSSKMA